MQTYNGLTASQWIARSYVSDGDVVATGVTLDFAGPRKLGILENGVQVAALTMGEQCAERLRELVEQAEAEVV